MTFSKEDGKTNRFELAQSRRFILDKHRTQKTGYHVALLLNFITSKFIQPERKRKVR